MALYLNTSLKAHRVYLSLSRNRKTITQSVESHVGPAYFEHVAPIGPAPGKSWIKDHNEAYWVVESEELKAHTEQREKQSP